MMDIQLPYGLKDGILTHISDVEQGLACGALCPACNAPLVARKGRIKQHHFAHAVDTDCATATETALHLAAKEILARRMEIVLPSVTVLGKTITPKRLYKIIDISVEAPIGRIIPDLLAVIEVDAPSGPKTGQIAIEIKVTHAIDDTKQRSIESMRLSTVEIDLGKINRTLNPDELEGLVVEGAARRWAYNDFIERKMSSILRMATVIKVKPRGYALHADGCPIRAREWNGRAYANVIDDCSDCSRLVSYDGDFIRCIDKSKVL